MDRRSLILNGMSLVAVLGPRDVFAAREPVLGGACEGCEWVFDGLPRALGPRARLAPSGESGAPMVVEGVVVHARGTPAPGVIVYAYHTDRAGLYTGGSNRHGRLRGWARTDSNGRYHFDTIRPGAYPTRDAAEHVHLHIIEPGVGTYYIDNLEFEDDPLQAGGRRAGRGGPGLMRPWRHDGVWQARRDIILGRNIPGHPGR
jgi:hypothetical protein